MNNNQDIVKKGDTIHDEYLYHGHLPVKLETNEDGVVTMIEGEIYRLHENDEE